MNSEKEAVVETNNRTDATSEENICHVPILFLSDKIRDPPSSPYRSIHSVWVNAPLVSPGFETFLVVWPIYRTLSFSLLSVLLLDSFGTSNVQYIVGF